MAGPRRRKGDKQDDGTADGAGDQGNSTAHSHSGSEPVRSGNSTPTDTEDGLPPRQITLKRAKRPSLAGKGRLSYTLQAPGTPWHELDLSEVDFLRHDVNEEPKTWVRYRRLFFVVGVALGAVLVLLFGTNAELDRHYRGLRLLLDEQIGNLDLSLDFKLPGEFAELAETLFSQPREWLATKDFRVGRRLLAQGYRAHHPVVLVPGIVSTGLESWSTSEDASGYFRKR